MNHQIRKGIAQLKQALGSNVLSIEVHELDGSAADATRQSARINDYIRKLVRTSDHDIVIAVLEVK